MPDIHIVWDRIRDNAGQVFTKVKGGKFHYKYYPNYINIIVNENGHDYTRNLYKSVFEKALELIPLKSTTQIQHLQGPSHIYAILTDDRIKQSDW